MSTYDMDLLLNKWERGTITTEQAVGQMLLLIQEVSQRVGSLEKRMEQRRRSMRVELVEETEREQVEEVERPSLPPEAVNELESEEK
ncbi:MAG: hypothetical protein H6658_09300 [Ardenticatenaceae bacterium]|nr:hypothetical protein [Ardenticatenaceae bacterium]